MNVKALCLRLFCLILLAGMTVSVAACSWAGRTAGRAQAKIERKVDSVESGYRDGYQEEKKKNPLPEQPADDEKT